MTLRWYAEVGPQEPLDQGDIIALCPVVSWKDAPIGVEREENVPELLKNSLELSEMAVVVMTQTCDLANAKVRNVTLCPYYPVDEYRSGWEAAQSIQGRNPTDKTWYAFLDSVRKGQVFSLALLNSDPELGVPLALVDFQEVFTLPRRFLESYIAATGERRVRLLPPYREHLSQAFARFFMRVGLPTDIDLSKYRR